MKGGKLVKRKQSLEDIYSDHMRDLFRYLLSLTGDSHCAEDLMQETFIACSSILIITKAKKLGRGYLQLPTTPLSIGIEKKKI